MACRGIFGSLSILGRTTLKETRFRVLVISLSSQEVRFINPVSAYFWQFIYLFLPKKFYHILTNQKT